jgi:carotenoid 1,2-hydratase
MSDTGLSDPDLPTPPAPSVDRGSARSPGFTSAVVGNGYRWWYIDALSDDGRHGLTIIVFIGSVFSPYYAAARREGIVDPRNHVCFNAVLYRPGGKRWAMTERSHSALATAEQDIVIGPSGMHWEGDRVVFSIEEMTVPIPRRLRGTVTLHLEQVFGEDFTIDERGHHWWWPISPACRVEVEMQQPSLSWRGHGYFDSNRGIEPLETGFRDWDWSRADLGDGESLVLYHSRMRAPLEIPERALSLRFCRDGRIERLPFPPAARLATTPIWRIRRETRADEGQSARVLKTFEDTPFYARSMLETTLLGRRVPAVHESLNLDRFSSRWVQFLLKFRMPRVVGTQPTTALPYDS